MSSCKLDKIYSIWLDVLKAHQVLCDAASRDSTVRVSSPVACTSARLLFRRFRASGVLAASISVRIACMNAVNTRRSTMCLNAHVRTPQPRAQDVARRNIGDLALHNHNSIRRESFSFHLRNNLLVVGGVEYQPLSLHPTASQLTARHECMCALTVKFL